MVGLQESPMQIRRYQLTLTETKRRLHFIRCSQQNLLCFSCNTANILNGVVVLTIPGMVPFFVKDVLRQIVWQAYLIRECQKIVVIDVLLNFEIKVT